MATGQTQNQQELRIAPELIAHVQSSLSARDRAKLKLEAEKLSTGRATVLWFSPMRWFNIVRMGEGTRMIWYAPKNIWDLHKVKRQPCDAAKPPGNSSLKPNRAGAAKKWGVVAGCECHETSSNAGPALVLGIARTPRAQRLGL
ncbi:MAG: hypothetical protein M1820_006693 [Bogoriella megaspora]|nr:MAG: hypothetical protein M1820_006693 [Bogoriella megaspora]